MTLKDISLRNFRNVESCSVSFSPGINFLVGENAQGKTNLLEALYLFARGKSFRGASDAELIRFGQAGWSAELTFHDGARDQTLRYLYDGARRQRFRNGAPVDKAGEMIGLFRAVLFCPDHLQMIKGSPEGRRNFLNVGLSQIDPEYLARYAKYQKFLDNRNALLKDAHHGRGFDRFEFFWFCENMSEQATYIHWHRVEYLKRIEAHAARILREISSEREELTLSYESEIIPKGPTYKDLNDAYDWKLAKNISRECAAGYSLFGVHRDDVDVKIGGVSARSFASQGQQRSIVLALKLAEGEVARECCGSYPVFLFDDVLSELDETRRAYIFKGAEDKQIVVTSCERETYSAKKTVTVKGGTYVPLSVSGTSGDSQDG